MSVFDVTALQNTEFTDALDTKVIPIPEGEFTAVAEKYEIRPVESKKNPGNTYVFLEVTWSIDSYEVQQATGRDKNSVRQSIILDMTDHGTLDMAKGRNVGLGRLREALGQNVAGKPWSFGHIIGQVATVLVSQRTDDEGNIFNEVKKVAKA